MKSAAHLLHFVMQTDECHISYLLYRNLNTSRSFSVEYRRDEYEPGITRSLPIYQMYAVRSLLSARPFYRTETVKSWKGDATPGCVCTRRASFY